MAWTKKPPEPKTPGYWWVRQPGRRPVIAEPFADNVWAFVASEQYSVSADLVEDGYEWWDTPIEPPK